MYITAAAAGEKEAAGNTAKHDSYALDKISIRVSPKVFGSRIRCARAPHLSCPCWRAGCDGHQCLLSSAGDLQVCIGLSGLRAHSGSADVQELPYHSLWRLFALHMALEPEVLHMDRIIQPWCSDQPSQGCLKGCGMPGDCS